MVNAKLGELGWHISFDIYAKDTLYSLTNVVIIYDINFKNRNPY